MAEVADGHALEPALFSNEPLWLVGYLVLFSSRLIVESKAIPHATTVAVGDAKFDARISIA